MTAPSPWGTGPASPVPGASPSIPARHEFFQVISGRLRIVDAAGQAREFGPGDAGIIPAGFVGTFEVLEAVTKRYVMLDRQGQ
jgi:uncharacterized cupin superfamily protein